MEHEKTKMPNLVGAVYDWLEVELLWIHEKWNAYCALFLSGGEPIDLLNSFAPDFFSMCREILAHDVVLALNRLGDPAKDRSGHDNLSLQRLIRAVEQAGNGDLAKELQDRHEVVQSAITPLREYRHKRLGHNDLKACLGTDEVVPSVTRQDVDKIVEAVAELLKAVPLYYDDAQVVFWGVGPDLGPRELLWQIKRCREQPAEQEP